VTTVIVYVLMHNEKNEGGTVEAVYSTEDKAREAVADRPAAAPFYWEIVPVEVDASSAELTSILVE
jgi:hypothetical protein